MGTSLSLWPTIAAASLPAAAPTALSLGTALQIGGAVFSGITSIMGARQQAAAQRAQLAYQAAIERNNALIAGYRKEQILRDEEQKLLRLQLSKSDLQGDQAVNLIAHGLDLSGTAGQLLDYTRQQAYMDAQLIEEQTARLTWNEDVNISNHLASAANYQTGASNVTTDYSGVGTALQGIGSALTTEKKFQVT